MGNYCFKKKELEDELDLLESGSLDKKVEKKQSDWRVVLNVLPYLWPKGEILVKISVIISLSFLVLAKVFNVMIPFAYKNVIDALSVSTVEGDENNQADTSSIYFPLGWIIAYGILKFFSKSLNDFRDTVFVRVTQGALRSAAIETFEHLHKLSLRFHLHRQTGTVLRSIERGTQGIGFLLRFALFNIGPTMVEIVFVCIILLSLYEVWIGLITFVTMVIYIASTIGITQWRIKFRREMNDVNNSANNKAIDSLLNFETVKYYTAEEHEAKRYDVALRSYASAAIRSQGSLAILNVAQSFTIAAGCTAVMLLSAYRCSEGTYQVGDVVLINTYLLQLYVPLNFLGTSFRLIKSSLVDLENMFSLLSEDVEVTDDEDCIDLEVSKGNISFDNVSFSYKPLSEGVQDEDYIFRNISFFVPEGSQLAIVGPTGAGKSTISRLLYRFYDVTDGNIFIDGQDIRFVSQYSLRKNIGIVPQDTVLFNDTILYNIRYGNLKASDEEVYRAAKMAQIHDFILTQPDGYLTEVGERGLRLSGGEKQRVAIARAILKDPKIMIFDEATSALDSKTEKAIQDSLNQVSQGRTTIIVAHRLSTIVDVDNIIVLKNGNIVEQGSHNELLDMGGEYYEMWYKQSESDSTLVDEDNNNNNNNDEDDLQVMQGNLIDI
eukprot:TRINITY_DN5726_c0_g2_i2.p1 TRINITY_DN5726_c0_g2~~TRINITY_DN5726_c0_g2_i2.p1  ORF type:complete len:717 (-),score=222.29 TRINITY_DN5726_c0_g2_i2:89-2074(-)